MVRNRWDDMEPDVFEIEDRRERRREERIRSLYESVSPYFDDEDEVQEIVDRLYEDED